MVAVTGAPGSDGVIRRAARMAARMKGDLHVIHVQSDEHSDAKALEPLRQLVEDVAVSARGARDDPARTVVRFAATTRSPRSWWGDAPEPLRGGEPGSVVRKISASPPSRESTCM